jgi:NitT/TauT family transport system ATP-binding protein
MVEIEITQLGKTFRGSDNKPVLKGIDLQVSKGEIVAIRGDNGTGKTTLLNLIAGIEDSTKGTINFRGLDGERLRVGYAQQDYTSSLLPWFDVLDNVAIPLRLQGVARIKRRRLAGELLESLGFLLPPAAYPQQLSGGQKQRVAIARALIHQPQLLLLDEPFANLDDHTSRDLQEVLLAIHYKWQQTILFISHNLDHCVYFADRILFLGGRPANITKEFDVPLVRPRNRKMLLTPEYNHIRSSIIAEQEAAYANARRQ